MPSTNNFELFRGEDATIEYTVRISDSASAAVDDITGDTFSMIVSADEDSPALLTIAGTIINASVGRVNFPIASADTASMSTGAYRVQFARTNSGRKHVLGVGTLTLMGKGL